jgi:hypothetical protein
MCGNLSLSSAIVLCTTHAHCDNGASLSLSTTLSSQLIVATTGYVTADLSGESLHKTRPWHMIDEHSRNCSIYIINYYLLNFIMSLGATLRSC